MDRKFDISKSQNISFNKRALHSIAQHAVALLRPTSGVPGYRLLVGLMAILALTIISTNVAYAAFTGITINSVSPSTIYQGNAVTANVTVAGSSVNWGSTMYRWDSGTGVCSTSPTPTISVSSSSTQNIPV